MQSSSAFGLIPKYAFLIRCNPTKEGTTALLLLLCGRTGWTSISKRLIRTFAS